MGETGRGRHRRKKSHRVCSMKRSSKKALNCSRGSGIGPLRVKLWGRFFCFASLRSASLLYRQLSFSGFKNSASSACAPARSDIFLYLFLSSFFFLFPIEREERGNLFLSLFSLLFFFLFFLFFLYLFFSFFRERVLFFPFSFFSPSLLFFFFFFLSSLFLSSFLVKEETLRFLLFFLFFLFLHMFSFLSLLYLQTRARDKLRKGIYKRNRKEKRKMN